MRTNTFLKFLANGKMPVETDVLDEAIERYQKATCDESLEDHDRKYHPNGFDPKKDTCKFRESMAKGDKADSVGESKGKKKIDDAFKISSSRIEPNGEAFDYHKYGMAYAERQPIKIDGRAYALADHCVDGALRELAGESSDINNYYLFFNGGVFGSAREIEDITGVRPGDSDSEEMSVLEFGSEKDLLDAYDKLNKVDTDAFTDAKEWKLPKGTPSDVEAYKIKRDFYDATRQKTNGGTTYDIDKGIGIIRALSDQELDDFAWTYNIGKYEKDKGNGEKSALAQAVEKVIAERGNKDLVKSDGKSNPSSEKAEAEPGKNFPSMMHGSSTAAVSALNNFVSRQNGPQASADKPSAQRMAQIYAKRRDDFKAKMDATIKAGRKVKKADRDHYEVLVRSAAHYDKLAKGGK